MESYYEKVKKIIEPEKVYDLNELTSAEEELESHLDTLNFLKETLASLGTEVEA